MTANHAEPRAPRRRTTPSDLSVHAIDTYREKLKIKLNLANGVGLNRYAVQWGLENG